jgi:UDP-N-acetylglucosamine transferase subunit ALG13
MGTLADDFIQKRLYRYINKFTACWVPDWKNIGSSAAGDLSHPKKLPGIPVRYIGCLSRLNNCDNGLKTTGLLIILSGPEPQRTALEDIMMRELRTFEGSGLLIRGVLNDGPVASLNKITILNYVSSTKLNSLICNADVVICRAGYTSIMDVLKLGKKTVLIPTPGQAEQEYLADRLHQQKRAIMATQKDFRLKSALEALSTQGIQTFPGSMEDYKKVVDDFCQSLKTDGNG